MQGSSTQNDIVSVGNLIMSRDKLTPQTKVSEVSDLFFTTPNLEAFALVEGMKPKGLITRSKLFFTLSRRYGNELFGREPILTIADTSPLIVFDLDLLEEVVGKAFERSPQNIYDEIIVTTKDGTYLGLLSVKQLVIEQSSALARSVMLEEVATTRAQEMEKINRVKSKFLTNVTHELRSPVNAIIGLAELLRMAADKGAVEQIQERLSFMISTATNLRGIITNILDLSKMEAGKMEVSNQVIDIVAMLSEIAEMTRILIGNKPINVVVFTSKEQVMISTDPIKLRQILTNLTSNAAKFTDEGSIEIGLSILEESLVISVCDTGMGIREEDLHIVFSAFGQVEDATTKSQEGSGLGLSISRNLAKLIGGQISVNSTYGSGSTFSLALPLEHIETQGVNCNAA